jgi:2-polyprenyl-6-methoxyphenol hydroxylase-like FAD-dependent oxidoreductase
VTDLKTTCCIAGGGPAGMMLGYLLARAGVKVLVIEKHGDFLRDFRGDTVHPSTLELMHELGILADFLSRPHSKVTELGGQIGDEFVMLADFTKLKKQRCKYIALMPQWDFLSFLSEKAQQYPGFELRMNTQAMDLIERDNKVIGLVAKNTSGEELKIEADLVIAADGRASTLRERAEMKVLDVGAPMDVLWMRLSRKSTDPPQTLGRIGAGTIFIMLNREGYWQCGFVIPKGRLEALRKEGLDKFRERITTIAPFTADRIDELKSWDDIKLLTVKVDRLEQWYRDGLLCIGDAAHAMSPIGGVGINLAIQDAVAAANILYAPLLESRCTPQDLAMVQQRRLYPTRMTQRLQVAIQNAVIKPTLESDKPASLPPLLRFVRSIPGFTAIPATIIGVGFRPEHIHSPNSFS